MNCKSMNINCASISTFVILIVTIFSNKFASACQGGYLLKTGITTQEERRVILDEHNCLRQSVAMGNVSGQPAAANMQEMQWDDELAAKAQQWANQCTFQHDPSRYLSRFIMGQNLGLLWSTAELAENDENFPSRIRNWFNEVQKYAWGAKWSVKTGHYSQLVWSSTNLVGCGFSYYYKDSRYNKLYVCNYGPGGNVINQMPYETGYSKCRTFGMADSAKYPGLCRPYELETNAIDDYAELTYNSINSQPSPPSYYTYRTLNGAYDGKVDKTFGLISNNDNVPPPSRTRLNIYNTNPSSNSGAYSSYYRRKDAIASSPTQNQQKQRQNPTQYYNNNQQNYRTITSTSTTKSPSQWQQKQTSHYQLSPLQRTPPPPPLVKQPVQPKRTSEENDLATNLMETAFRTYRWDLLFKRNHLL